MYLLTRSVTSLSLRDDPVKLLRYAQGLSHFLEHMLFLGSTKYPGEAAMDAYLARHGGGSNAWTDLEYTCYHFDVDGDHLAPALDRFAQFFISPKFEREAMEREVNAVDAEFVSVVQSDSGRLSQLLCHTAREGHPYGKFGWGNRRSLWDVPQAAGVLQFPRYR